MISSEFFQNRIESRQTELSAAKKRDGGISVVRLVLGISMILAFYGYFTTDYSWLIYLFFTVIVAFIFVLRMHRKLKAHIAFIEHWIAVNQAEVDFLNDDFSSFKSGDEYKDPSHPFSGDLDVFGPKSLFQRIARTITKDGTNILAGWFNGVNQINHIVHRQDAVKELASKLDWRQDFLANGHGVEANSSVKERIQQWNEYAVKESWMLHPLVVWGLTFCFSATAVAIYFIGDLTVLKYLAVPFLLNLFLFGKLLKDFKAEREFVDDLSKTFSSYSKLIESIENEAFNAQILKNLQLKLASNDLKASVALKQFSKILDQLDSLDNAFGAAIINGLLQYHLHVFKKMLKWKKAHGKNMTQWLEVINEFDAWISLANYAHLNDTFTYPQIDQSAEFEAEALGHPFLKEGVRITNDLRFDGFKLVILTGSNMAGKSTFLRSIGVNLIFTSLGLPVCAKHLKTRHYQLLSSMKPQDSLTSNESYFQAEVNRLRMLVDLLESDQKSFVLLDEILRGTNSQDKRNGTKAFLEKIKVKQLVGIIATHDVEITELTAQQEMVYSNRFFESQLKNNELVFDYKLRNGVCETPNATDLMRIKGII